jgi:uncharacterized OsmC-like protein
VQGITGRRLRAEIVMQPERGRRVVDDLAGRRERVSDAIRGAERGRRIEVAVELTGPLTLEQRSELMKTAATCPIHHLLKGEVDIRLRAANGA